MVQVQAKVPSNQNQNTIWTRNDKNVHHGTRTELSMRMEQIQSIVFFKGYI